MHERTRRVEWTSVSYYMLRITLLAILALVVSTLGWCAYEIGLADGWWNPLIRPAGVPAGAHYVLIFPKSATWFDCRVDEKRDIDVCTAWDGDGRLLVSGDFRLKDEGRAATRAELQPSIVEGDASGHFDTIHLFGPNRSTFGKELVRVGSRAEREHFSVDVDGGRIAPAK